MPLSFATDIRPLFRDEPDVKTMKRMGLDLSSYNEVKASSADIYARLENGTMPCDGPWPKEHLKIFKQWIDEGAPP